MNLRQESGQMGQVKGQVRSIEVISIPPVSVKLIIFVYFQSK